MVLPWVVLAVSGVKVTLDPNCPWYPWMREPEAFLISTPMVQMTMMERAVPAKRRPRPRYLRIFFIALVMMYKSGPFR